MLLDLHYQTDLVSTPFLSCPTLLNGARGLQQLAKEIEWYLDKEVVEEEDESRHHVIIRGVYWNSQKIYKATISNVLYI